MAANSDIVEHRKTAIGSEKSFGLVFGVVFLLISLTPLLRGAAPRWWALILATVFAVLAFWAPALLAPLNRVWFRFGLLLHRIVNPLIMALLYFGAVVPIGLILRAQGKDLLRLKRDRAAPSYWIARDPAGPARGSMSKQF